jgi:uncharacterized Fe-S center protein
LTAKVYYIPAAVSEGEQAISEKARRLFRAGGFKECFRPSDFTAVKVHVGEDVNTTYLKAPCLRGLVEELVTLKTKPFITDTSTLYTGRRHNAIDHAILAERGPASGADRYRPGRPATAETVSDLRRAGTTSPAAILRCHHLSGPFWTLCRRLPRR